MTLALVIGWMWRYHLLRLQCILERRASSVSWYVGPHEIVKQCGNVSYRLDLASDLSFIYSVFYVSKLRKLVGDTSAIFPLEGVEVEDNLSFEKVLMEVLDGQVEMLHNGDQHIESATWGVESNRIQ